MAIKLSSIDQFEQIINENKYVFVLKHSETCPISANAIDQFNKFLYERDMDGFYLIVQQERELSDYIEEKTKVKHESPQAFYFVKGQAIWNASHEDINVSTLASAEE
ncbi:bacillithiol system redox-active protein YtxJ [Staphylococcus shinii]|uniref:Bacillithiol system redox-active protein YtxJ n=1 Tax=Staphylococcus shinii TaxID=2912228 RepID=A0A418IJC6_9STAP|nr:bacillithiol system redox-active protein YtxJ [Staphylococcus shinii]MDW8564257.1 bacillithiol system redox-active protein YtxJ [Staphylococcus shinii]MDW8567484.1 bacillithiol system redox-active protein YtxJ [Staphylococcus shinii]PKI09812.1 bacillithiol system redox-active protein YtxJ [Staphylococcus shinii]PKI14660.1 bacillithiol system redox-active protein YtxJ [Staphylococcus shinii]PTI00916.1 bacillithiol system redox-active protein YtxJ [Staphylococcus shinii]